MADDKVKPSIKQIRKFFSSLTRPPKDSDMVNDVTFAYDIWTTATVFREALAELLKDE